MLVSGDVLGTLRLPCQYDAITSLLRKGAGVCRIAASARRRAGLSNCSAACPATAGPRARINKMIEQVADQRGHGADPR